MLDGEVPEKVDKVWGFAVPTLKGGRRQWPKELRAMAVERIAAGEGIREIAEEIGANKSLVAHWVKNAQRKDSAPAFFEVVPPTEVKSGRKHRTTVAPGRCCHDLPDQHRRRRYCDTARLSGRSPGRGAARGEGLAVISPAGSFRIFLASEPIDFRKGMDGLVAANHFDLDPLDGAIYVFRFRRADRLKLLV